MNNKTQNEDKFLDFNWFSEPYEHPDWIDTSSFDELDKLYYSNNYVVERRPVEPNFEFKNSNFVVVFNKQLDSTKLNDVLNYLGLHNYEELYDLTKWHYLNLNMHFKHKVPLILKGLVWIFKDKSLGFSFREGFYYKSKLMSFLKDFYNIFKSDISRVVIYDSRIYKYHILTDGDFVEASVDEYKNLIKNDPIL